MCIICILLAAPGSSGHGFDSRDLVVQNTNVVTTHPVWGTADQQTDRFRERASVARGGWC